jgi:hypothetical protein
MIEGLGKGEGYVSLSINYGWTQLPPSGICREKEVSRIGHDDKSKDFGNVRGPHGPWLFKRITIQTMARF